MSEKAENLAQWFEALAKTADMDAFGREPITGIGAEACREVAGYIRSQAERIKRLTEEVERLKLDIRAQDALNDRAYISGVKAGWNLGVVEDNDGLARITSTRDHIAELNEVRRARAALGGPNG